MYVLYQKWLYRSLNFWVTKSDMKETIRLLTERSEVSVFGRAFSISCVCVSVCLSVSRLRPLDRLSWHFTWMFLIARPSDVSIRGFPFFIFNLTQNFIFLSPCSFCLLFLDFDRLTKQLANLISMVLVILTGEIYCSQNYLS